MIRQLMATVRGRFVLLITLLVVSVSLILAFFSFYMLKSTVESRGETYMESTVHLMSEQIDQEYTRILQISQHMTINGFVGKQVNESLRAQTMYDLGEAKRVLSSGLQTITAIGSQIELALYCSPDGKEIFATTFLPKENFNPVEGLRNVRQTRSLSFHAVHASQSRFSNSPVLSVIWPETFAGDRDLIIYVEVRTSLPDFLQEINRNGQSEYTFLQIAREGDVCYCSDPTLNPPMLLSDLLASPQTFGMTDGYVWCKQSSKFNFYNVLMISKSDFYLGLFSWIRILLAAVLLSAFLLFLSVVLFNRMIQQKLQVMLKAVDAVKRPDLILTQERTGLREYDLLMDRFDGLLLYARKLIDEVKRQEVEKSRLELETLYYQINPHFLMNSLNSLYWLARLNSQKEISSYVHHLMELLSYSLGRTGDSPTLRRELDALKDYLALEREKHTFTALFDIEEGAYLDSPTPRLFLQPLVENAVNHGMDSNGTLTISVHPDTLGVLINIEDDGCGLTPDQLEQLRTMELILQNGGIGLRYSASMIRQFYGEDASLRIENRIGGGTRVAIKLGMWKEREHDQSSSH